MANSGVDNQITLQVILEGISYILDLLSHFGRSFISFGGGFNQFGGFSEFIPFLALKTILKKLKNPLKTGRITQKPAIFGLYGVYGMKIG